MLCVCRVQSMFFFWLVRTPNFPLETQRNVSYLDSFLHRYYNPRLGSMTCFHPAAVCNNETAIVVYSLTSESAKNVVSELVSSGVTSIVI